MKLFLAQGILLAWCAKISIERRAAFPTGFETNGATINLCLRCFGKCSPIQFEVKGDERKRIGGLLHFSYNISPSLQFITTSVLLFANAHERSQNLTQELEHGQMGDFLDKTWDLRFKTHVMPQTRPNLRAEASGRRCAENTFWILLFHNMPHAVLMKSGPNTTSLIPNSFTN